jgi:hypothetical protein
LLEIRKVVCALFKIEPESILRQTGKKSASGARVIFCYTAIRVIGMTGVEVGDFLSMGPYGVSRAVGGGPYCLDILSMGISYESILYS